MRGAIRTTVALVGCLAASMAPSRAQNQGDSLAQARRELLLMGSRFAFGAYADSEAAAERAVAVGIAEVERIERIISSWDPASETSAVNAAAGGAPVAVSTELIDLVARCAKVSALTDGAFDITAGGLGGLYRFAGQDTVLPGAAQLRTAAALIDYRAVEIDRAAGTLRLARPGMRMGFGAIGKGYAANRARDAMAEVDGVRGGVVDASGDLATFGRGADSAWHIGIADPRHPDRWLGQLDVAGDAAVVTSGDYEKYFTAGGVRYAHIIDPRTALPTTGVRSATVACADAEVADALATAIFVLGHEVGLQLLDRLRGVEGLVVAADGSLHTSSGLALAPFKSLTDGQY